MREEQPFVSRPSSLTIFPLAFPFPFLSSPTVDRGLDPRRLEESKEVDITVRTPGLASSKGAGTVVVVVAFEEEVADSVGWREESMYGNGVLGITVSSGSTWKEGARESKERKGGDGRESERVEKEVESLPSFSVPSSSHDRFSSRFLLSLSPRINQGRSDTKAERITRQKNVPARKKEKQEKRAEPDSNLYHSLTDPSSPLQTGFFQ